MTRRRILFAVEKRLPPRQLVEFRKLLLNPRTTIDQAEYWLDQRGIIVSPNAVRNYRQRYATKSVFQFQVHRKIMGDDAELRRCVGLWAEKLAGDDLRRLAMFTAYLLNLKAVETGRLNEGMQGLVPLWETGDRTPV